MEGRTGLGGNRVGLNWGAERRRPGAALQLAEGEVWGTQALRIGRFKQIHRSVPSAASARQKEKKSISLICGSACLNKTSQRSPSDKKHHGVATAGFALPGNFPARKKCARIYGARVPIFQAGGGPFSATGLMLGARLFFICRISNPRFGWPQPLVVK